MSRLALVRTVGAPIGALAALMAFSAWPGWAGLLAGFVAFGFVALLVERAFRALASPDEIRADLEDRTRSPPA